MKMRTLVLALLALVTACSSPLPTESVLTSEGAARSTSTEDTDDSDSRSPMLGGTP